MVTLSPGKGVKAALYPLPSEEGGRTPGRSLATRVVDCSQRDRWHRRRLRAPPRRVQPRVHVAPTVAGAYFNRTSGFISSAGRVEDEAPEPPGPSHLWITLEPLPFTGPKTDVGTKSN